MPGKKLPLLLIYSLASISAIFSFIFLLFFLILCTLATSLALFSEAVIL